MSTLKDKLRALSSLSSPFAFDPSSTPLDPQTLFLDWLQLAIDTGIREPHAMILSTVDANNEPDARVLILKNLDDNGWHFSTGRNSPKGQQIENSPSVALTFYWQKLGRQVRIRGTGTDMGFEQRNDDFLDKPIGSRIQALLGKQSKIVASHKPDELATARMAAFLAQHPAHVDPNWTVYAVKPREVEFWQAHQQRQHVRLRYRLGESCWIKELLGA
ncbi:pyridoxal 5'-phosphate synthase [Phyllobacterium sp. SB3]|uniref:pyridoxine/pyridoxamine 5'-phosphate oxidase n=1 Tax=Phyllobacterium sp. SB3 TaxID=3156073 RepID=UPI0032AFCA6A